MIRRPPLREFVYLDAVSLHSLLVSQNTTIPENVSEAIIRADEAELKGGISTDALLAKAEATARYQTSNSNNVQSSRKAVIQTLFKEFRDLNLDFKFAPSDDDPKPPLTREAITDTDDPAIAQPDTALKRGALVEIEVTLAVDPVFKLGTMMTEWTAMVDDVPTMVSSREALTSLEEVRPVMKVLDRLLAGLIPIKATAVNYVVAEIDGQEYVVHKNAIVELGIVTRPLKVVGVTEHLGYWKDIRRILFSEGRFTMLCRIARDGVQQSWTPVKLADVFTDIAPELVQQINSIERFGPKSVTSSALQDHEESAIVNALRIYKEELVSQTGSPWPNEAEDEFESAILRLQQNNLTTSAQREAFHLVKHIIIARSDHKSISPEADLHARQQARAAAGLALFPALTRSSAINANTQNMASNDTERMIDVEIIAIYW